MPNGPQQMQAMMNQINMLMQQISMGPAKEEEIPAQPEPQAPPSKSDLAFGALFKAEATSVKTHPSPGTSFDASTSGHSFSSEPVASMTNPGAPASAPTGTA